MVEQNNNLVLFSGTSNVSLSKKVAQELGKKLGDAFVGRFSDDELNVRIDEHVRGMDVFIIQSTCYPANENLMELLIMIDALRSCLLYTSPSPRDLSTTRMPSSA